MGLVLNEMEYGRDVNSRHLRCRLGEGVTIEARLFGPDAMLNRVVPRTLSFLPLCHIAERVGGEYHALYRNLGGGRFRHHTQAAGLGRLGQSFVGFGTAFDGRAGFNLVEIDTSQAGYGAGHDYQALLYTGTVGGIDGLAGFANPSTALVNSQDGYQAGDLVNIEVDVMAKYVERLMSAYLPPNEEGAR